MPCTQPPIHDLVEHTFGLHHFRPPPLPERLDSPSLASLAGVGSQTLIPEQDLDQRIREVGEW